MLVTTAIILKGLGGTIIKYIRASLQNSIVMPASAVPSNLWVISSLIKKREAKAWDRTRDNRITSVLGALPLSYLGLLLDYPLLMLSTQAC